MGSATFAWASVHTVVPTRMVRSSTTQPQPVSSVSTSRTLPSIAMRSPGNTGLRIAMPRRPSRAVGPAQSVTKRSSQLPWVCVSMNTSRTPWRCTA